MLLHWTVSLDEGLRILFGTFPRRKLLLIRDTPKFHIGAPANRSSIVHSMKAAYHTQLVKRLLFGMQNSQELKIAVGFPGEVLASISQQLKTDVIENFYREAGFLRNSGAASKEPSGLNSNASKVRHLPF